MNENPYDSLEDGVYYNLGDPEFDKRPGETQEDYVKRKNHLFDRMASVQRQEKRDANQRAWEAKQKARAEEERDADQSYESSENYHPLVHELFKLENTLKDRLVNRSEFITKIGSYTASDIVAIENRLATPIYHILVELTPKLHEAVNTRVTIPPELIDLHRANQIMNNSQVGFLNDYFKNRHNGALSGGIPACSTMMMNGGDSKRKLKKLSGSKRKTKSAKTKSTRSKGTKNKRKSRGTLKRK